MADVAADSPALGKAKVSAVGEADGDFVDISTRAYAKIIMHAAKYPHAAVNGVLLTKLPPKGPSARPVPKLHFVDVIPLFHQVPGLSPMLEVALGQIETRASNAGMAVAGYYHANQLLKDTRVDVFSQRVADRIADHCPGGRAALLTVDNKKLGVVLEAHALVGQVFEAGAGKWRQCKSSGIGVDDHSLHVAASLVQNRAHKDLVDFDNHLDDVSCDYLNVSLNMEIDSYASNE